MEATTDNPPESWHSGTADRLPPEKDNLNGWINAAESEKDRQWTKYVQAANGIKTFALKPN